MNDELNKSPPQHTPVPYWVDDDGFIAAGHGDDYQTVADPHCRPTVDYGEENDANAVFIVRACNHHLELLTALERAFDILEGIADKLLYEEGQPVTAIESREIEDIYNDAICELAPFETLIRKARGMT
jgi:hypothetical protein